MAITRTPMVDDDGTGTTGTVINAAWKTEFYDQIDAAIAADAGGSLVQNRLLGRGAASGTGAPEALTLGTGLTMAGTVVSATVEGNWTPSITGTAGAPSYGSSNGGRYVRVGRLVHCNGVVQFTAKGGLTGALKLNNFPFNNDPQIYAPITVGYCSGLTAAQPSLGGLVDRNVTWAALYKNIFGTGTSPLDAADVGDAWLMVFTVTYYAAT